MGAKRYKAGLYPNEESMAEFVRSGIQKGVKEDENGKYFEVTRDQTRTFGDVITKFAPPIVYGKDGAVIRQYVDADGKTVRSWLLATEDEPKAVGEKILIGNGSEVELTVAVFDTRKGKGQRLESVKVLDLIEYKKPDVIVDAETPYVEDAPVTAPATPEAAAAASAEAPKKAAPAKQKGAAPWAVKK
jgi:hypothetical protein